MDADAGQKVRLVLIRRYNSMKGEEIKNRMNFCKRYAAFMLIFILYFYAELNASERMFSMFSFFGGWCGDGCGFVRWPQHDRGAMRGRNKSRQKNGGRAQKKRNILLYFADIRYILCERNGVLR